MGLGRSVANCSKIGPELMKPIGKSDFLTCHENPNRDWWEANPMTYDWEKSLAIERFAEPWFDEIDRRFFQSAYYAQSKGAATFSRFIPESEIRGMRTLEIGCGMGSHAELLTRRGAHLTAIDQTDFAVDSTRRRLELRRLPHDVRRIDAEVLPLESREFDLVWTWGAIHHSCSTENILQNIGRVLKPGGSLRMMVYYRPSLVYWVHCGLIRGVLLGGLLRKRLDQIYVDATDGFFARTFSKRELTALLEDDFKQVRFSVIGLKAELYPIPRTDFKTLLEQSTPDWLAVSLLSHWGSMIYVDAVRR